MKSLKIALENCNYPLFIDTGLISRFNEFCDLYRFSAKKIMLSNEKESNHIKQFLHSAEKIENIVLPFEILNFEINSILKIFNFLPWDKFRNGVTLITVGEDWLIRSVALAKQLSTYPVQLVCVPTSFWSMLETGVNDSFFFDWKKKSSVLKTDYCPSLVLLDVDFLNSQNPDDTLLGITVVLRHLLMVNPDIFHLFKSNIPEIFSNKAQENVQIVEELVASRLSLFQNEHDKKCLKDFGVRFLDSYRSRLKNILSTREFAVMVLIDICWRWKIGKELKICQSEDTDSIFALIEKICINNHVTSNEWNQAKNSLLKTLSKDFLNNIHLPESIGNFKCVDTIDLILAKQCLQEL